MKFSDRFRVTRAGFTALSAQEAYVDSFQTDFGELIPTIVICPTPAHPSNESSHA